MRTRAAVFFLLRLTATGACAVDVETPKNQPIDITYSGETQYEDGIAIAHGNVAIHLGDTDIYADSARYNSKTHEVFAEGHVRIYRESTLYIAERGVYNVDTKEIHAENLRSSSDPYLIRAEKLQAFSDGHYLVNNG